MTYMLREPLCLISPLYFEAWLRSRNKLLRIIYTNITYCSEFLEEPVLKTASNWKLWFPLHLTLFYTAVTSLGAGYVSPITCYSKTISAKWNICSFVKGHTECLAFFSALTMFFCFYKQVCFTSKTYRLDLYNIFEFF